MNHVFLSGNIATDLETLNLANGGIVTRFRLAVHKPQKSSGTGGDTDFLNIVAYNGTAQYAQKNLRKGNRVSIEGHVQTHAYSAPDGTPRSIVQFVARRIDLVLPVSVCGIEVEPENDDTLPA